MFSTGCWSDYEGDTYDVITKKEDLEGLFRCIEANILVKQREIEELRKELKEVKAEKYKDEEIQLVDGGASINVINPTLIDYIKITFKQEGNFEDF